MTDEPIQHSPASPGSGPGGATSTGEVSLDSGASEAAPPDEAHPQPERSSGPRLWPRVAGVLILVAGVLGAWVWQNPGFLPTVLGSLVGGSTDHGTKASIEALEARVAQLEQRPPPADLRPLTQRLDALEQRFGQSQGQIAAAIRPLLARLDALEARPAATVTPPESGASVPIAPTPTPAASDLHPLLARIEALERQQAGNAGDPARLDALAARVDTLAAREPAANLRSKLDDVESRLNELTASETKQASSSDRTARLAQLEIALGAGRPLGAIPNAPPALARFASTAPPTEAGLRLAFVAASRAALKVSVPDTEGRPFIDRVLARLQDFRLITVREGDRVVIGSSVAATLLHAQVLLDAGDLSGAARTVATLTGPPAAQMASWLADATALQAAREALASLAESG